MITTVQLTALAKRLTSGSANIVIFQRLNAAYGRLWRIAESASRTVSRKMPESKIEV